MRALRRPLLLTFFLGCFVAAAASGRFSVRLILDGAVSFAFIPTIEVLTLLVIRQTGSCRRLPLSEAIDRFFEGQRPWLVWMAVAAGLVAIDPPRRIGAWFDPILLTALVPLSLSILRDFQFFRHEMDRSARGALNDVLLYRAIAWPCMTAYFLGVAIWTETLSGLLQHGAR